MVKKNALTLLRDFTKWADIEAAHLINCTQILDHYVVEVGSSHVPHSSSVLSRGKSLWKTNKSPEQAKQEFYVELLKCIQFWSLCYPNAIKSPERKSKVKQEYEELRNRLRI